MIRLITCDIDGTLLPEGEWELSPSIYPLIRRLKDRGIAFAAASGRQHFRLRQMFEPVAKDIFFICENGAVVFDGDTPLSETRLDPEKAHTLIAQILAIAECEVLISGAKCSYLLPKTQEYVHHIRDRIGYRVQIVSSVEEIPEPIIKVSAYRKDGADVLVPRFSPQWATEFNMAIAGLEWLDFTLSDKGTGLDVICKAMSISPKQVMSFGDNYNDVPLLEKVGYPYIMENAVPALKDRFPLHCKKVSDTLEKFLGQSVKTT